MSDFEFVATILIFAVFYLSSVFGIMQLAHLTSADSSELSR